MSKFAPSFTKAAWCCYHVNFVVYMISRFCFLNPRYVNWLFFISLRALIISISSKGYTAGQKLHQADERMINAPNLVVKAQVANHKDCWFLDREHPCLLASHEVRFDKCHPAKITAVITNFMKSYTFFMLMATC